MRKKILFTIAVSVFLTFPAVADITVEETTDAEYLINAGYSQSVAEEVFIMKNRATGKPIEPLYDKSQNVFVKCWRQFYAYLDPAIESEDRIHHDIKNSPSWSDL